MNRLSKVLLLATLLSFLKCSAAAQEARIWTDNQGRTVTATLVEFVDFGDNPSVLIRLENGRTAEIGFDTLSAADQEYLRSQAAAAPVTSISLFGAKIESRRLVIAADLSFSVVNSLREYQADMGLFRQAIDRALQQLPDDAEINIILFVRRHTFFAPELMPVAQARSQLPAWLEVNFRQDGASDRHWLQLPDKSGIEAALEAAVELRADDVLLLTDGLFFRSTAEGHERIRVSDLIAQLDILKSDRGLPLPRIHAFGFVRSGDPGSESILRELTAFTGGVSHTPPPQPAKP